MDLSIIIFAALALFLSYQLFAVLGRRDGHEPDEKDRPVLRPVGANDGASEQGEDQAPPQSRGDTLPPWAKTIAESYPDFDPANFLAGSVSAYEMVAQAFADGNLSSVEGFLAPDVLSRFQSAIEARKASGHSLHVTFVGIDKPEVVETVRDQDVIRASLRFRSEQVRAVNDREGNVVDGSEDTVISVVDQWTFSRPVKSNDPNWTLIAT